MGAFIIVSIVMGVLAFAAVRNATVVRGLVGLAIRSRRVGVGTRRESARLRKARAGLASDPAPDLDDVERDVSTWIERVGGYYRSLGTYVLGAAIVSSAVNYFVFGVTASRAQERGWSLDQFMAFASAATTALALSMAVAGAVIVVRFIVADARLRQRPGNLHADLMLIASRELEAPAPAILGRHPGLSQLFGVGPEAP